MYKTILKSIPSIAFYCWVLLLGCTHCTCWQLSTRSILGTLRCRSLLYRLMGVIQCSCAPIIGKSEEIIPSSWHAFLSRQQNSLCSLGNVNQLPVCNRVSLFVLSCYVKQECSNDGQSLAAHVFDALRNLYMRLRLEIFILPWIRSVPGWNFQQGRSE